MAVAMIVIVSMVLITQLGYILKLEDKIKDTEMALDIIEEQTGREKIYFLFGGVLASTQGRRKEAKSIASFHALLLVVAVIVVVVAG